MAIAEAQTERTRAPGGPGLKVFVGVVLLAAAAVVLLGPTFSFNLTPEKLLEILRQAATELIKFLTKFLEGLA